MGTRAPLGVEGEERGDGSAAGGVGSPPRVRSKSTTATTTSTSTTATATASRNHRRPGTRDSSSENQSEPHDEPGGACSASGPQCAGTGPFPAPVLRCSPVEPVSSGSGRAIRLPVDVPGPSANSGRCGRSGNGGGAEPAARSEGSRDAAPRAPPADPGAGPVDAAA